MNRPDGRTDYYNSYEASITRRMTQSWSMLAAYTGTKYHRWIAGIPQSPNDEYFDLDNQWRWAFKLNGNYNFPKDISVGAIVEVRNGVLGQRTYVFRATDAERPAAAAAGVGDHPARAVWLAARRSADDLQCARVQAHPLPKGFLNVSFDVLNVLNINAITAATYVSGPSYGRVTDILPPRTIRFGVIYDF